MKFFAPLLPKNVSLRVVGFYLKPIGRNVKPVILNDFRKDSCKYLKTNIPMTFAVEVLLFGDGWERTQHIIYLSLSF